MGLEDQETRHYVIHYWLENVCLNKKFSKCKLAHNFITFFIYTQTNKHKANHFVTSGLLFEIAEQMKNG